MSKWWAMALRPGWVIGLAVAGSALLMWVAPVPRLKTSKHQPVVPPPGFVTARSQPAPSMLALVTRPIFSLSRRPPPPIPLPIIAVPTKPVPTTNGMVLLGVLNTGTKTVALITLPQDPHPHLVAVGDELGDWEVTRILADRLILRAANTDAELVLPKPALPTAQSAVPSISQPGTFLPGMP